MAASRGFRGAVLPALGALAVVALSGCATIIHGSTQAVAIQSNPSGAVIAVNGVRNAQTPATLSLDRKSPHALEITLDGYRPFQMQLQRTTSGWVWGNIVFGGLIGLVVDASTGAMYRLTPEQVHAQLQASGAALSTTNPQGADPRPREDRVYIFVTLDAVADAAAAAGGEGGWEVVGWLEVE